MLLNNISAKKEDGKLKEILHGNEHIHGSHYDVQCVLSIATDEEKV